MNPTKPLDGIKILELSTVVTAALAATLMSEQGASTVKVEPLRIGDTLRHLGTGSAGISAMFANCNRGKRSISLDLKAAEGLEVVRKLALEADILISNYRPGVLSRLGLDSDTLREANPGLIYLAISGFGTQGPLAEAPAYDHVIQAMSGMTDVQGADDELAMIKTFVCDEVTAYTACQAATAALFQRCNSGLGQHIDISMLNSAIYFLWPAGMAEHTFQDDDVQRRPAFKHTYRTYPTADGYITMAPLTNTHWHGLFDSTGRQDMATDPRYATIAGRSEHMTELFEEFQDAFSQMSREQAQALLAKLDIPGMACLTLDEVMVHPQVEAIGAIQTQQHPTLGELRSPAHPSQFGGRQFAPLPALGSLGEHTREVLGELGYSGQAIEDLLDSGVVAEAS
jgi:crotonobetainyl-CoA:carnitine CoA-transferase CaiB-like acyl-CoA transferase